MLGLLLRSIHPSEYFKLKNTHFGMIISKHYQFINTLNQMLRSRFG
jgi:hypothetical protein